MTENHDKPGETGDGVPVAPVRPLSPAARRALDEARARREGYDEVSEKAPREINGRGGLDPARFGDWENKGIASDF